MSNEMVCNHLNLAGQLWICTIQLLGLNGPDNQTAQMSGKCPGKMPSLNTV